MTPSSADEEPPPSLPFGRLEVTLVAGLLVSSSLRLWLLLPHGSSLELLLLFAPLTEAVLLEVEDFCNSLTGVWGRLLLADPLFVGGFLHCMNTAAGESETEASGNRNTR